MLSSDNKKKKTKRKLIKITGNEDSVTDNSKVTEQPVKKRRKTKAKCEDIEISEDRSQNESDSGEKDITVISEDTCSQGWCTLLCVCVCVCVINFRMVNPF